jgi:hypothetical protein
MKIVPLKTNDSIDGTRKGVILSYTHASDIEETSQACAVNEKDSANREVSLTGNKTKKENIRRG